MHSYCPAAADCQNITYTRCVTETRSTELITLKYAPTYYIRLNNESGITGRPGSGGQRRTRGCHRGWMTGMYILYVKQIQKNKQTISITCIKICEHFSFFCMQLYIYIYRYRGWSWSSAIPRWQSKKTILQGIGLWRWWVILVFFFFFPQMT